MKHSTIAIFDSREEAESFIKFERLRKMYGWRARIKECPATQKRPTIYRVLLPYPAAVEYFQYKNKLAQSQEPIIKWFR